MANTEPGAPLEAGIIPQKIRKLPIVPLLIISHFIATAAGRVTADDHAPQPTPITAPEIPDAGLDQAAELLSSESVAIILDAWNGKSFGKTPNADGGASVENLKPEAKDVFKKGFIIGYKLNDELSKLLKYKVTMESGEFDFIPVGAGISSVRRLDNLVYATYTSTKSDGGISGKISFSVDLQTGKVKLLGSNQPSKGSKLPNSEFAHLKDETAIRAEYATINSKIRDIENRGWGNEKNEDYLARMNEIRNLEARRTRLERYATEKGITLERLL